jgi:hypothetical protein
MEQDESSDRETHAQSTHSEDIPIVADRPNSAPTSQISKYDGEGKSDNGTGWSDRWMVRLTAALAFFGLCSVVAALLQWNEMHTGAADTHDLAVAAKSQSDNTRTIADAAKAQAENTEQLAEATKTLAEIAKRNFLVTRPSIVVDHVNIVKDSQGGMQYTVWLVNDSAIPATSFDAQCEIYLNGGLVPAEPFPNGKPLTFGAGQHFTLCNGVLTNGLYARLKEGRATLQIFAHATYSGPAGKYRYCTKHQYAYQFDQFANLGDCDASKPFPQ